MTDTRTPSDVDVAEHAEEQQNRNQPDPFPEEGTDEKIVKPDTTADKPLSDGEAVRATKAVIASGLSGGGKASPDWPQGQPEEALDDGSNKSSKPTPGL